MAAYTPTCVTAAISIANQHKTLKVYFAFLIFLSIIFILWNYNFKLSIYAALPSSLTSRTVKMITSDSSKKVDYNNSSASMFLRTMSPQLVEPDYDCAKQYYGVCEINPRTCPFLCCRNVYHRAFLLMEVVVKLTLF